MCIGSGTQTGRFTGGEMCFTELPKGADYMTTTNRAQLAAAVAAVDPASVTVIEALSETGKVLCRYTFPRKSGSDLLNHEAHVNKLARTIRKTPANIWR